MVHFSRKKSNLLHINRPSCFSFSHITILNASEKMLSNFVLFFTVLLVAGAFSRPYQDKAHSVDICNYRLFNNIMRSKNMDLCSHHSFRKRREVPKRNPRKLLPLKSYQTLEYNLVGDRESAERNLISFGGVNRNSIMDNDIKKPLRCIGAVMMMAMCY